MMKRIPRWVYYAAGSVLLAIYLTVMTAVSTRSVETQMCTGLLITVHDTAELRFINPYELARDLGDLPSTITRTRRCDINLDSLERLLASFDKIERVNVNLLTDGKVHIDVWQMRPVARIFGPVASSYYINRSGKRIAADARYHIDVPVVYGSFNDSIFPATSILPLVDYIQADSVWSRMVDDQGRLAERHNPRARDLQPCHQHRRHYELCRQIPSPGSHLLPRDEGQGVELL